MTAAARRPTAATELMASWPLALGFALLAVPTILRLADQTWSKDAAAQGPLVLASGAWLLWREWPQLVREARPARPWIVAPVLAVSLLAYVFGRAFDFITLEAAGLYGAGLAMLLSAFGPRALAAIWFPLAYLAAAVPPPAFLVDSATAPLKHFVTWVATGGTAAVGLPVAREGVTIFVGQYQLLVEDACSGMNSLVGLSAISLLYVYLMRRASLAYALLLAACVVPIAIAANIVRIVVLILLTFFFGDAVAQSFLHFAAGLFLFTVALLLVFALDSVLWPLTARIGGRIAARRKGARP